MKLASNRNPAVVVLGSSGPDCLNPTISSCLFLGTLRCCGQSKLHTQLFKSDLVVVLERERGVVRVTIISISENERKLHLRRCCLNLDLPASIKYVVIHTYGVVHLLTSALKIIDDTKSMP
jgi:hypothetical protein